MHLNLKINNKKRTARTYREAGQDTPGTRGAVRRSVQPSYNRTYITIFCPETGLPQLRLYNYQTFKKYLY